MKKIIASLLLIGLTGALCFAQNIEFETIETVFSFKAVHSLPVNYSQKIKDSFIKGNYKPVLTSFLKSCQPYNENININFLGFDFSINLKSNGWVNQKCSYEFIANVNSISPELKQMFSINAQDSEISSVKPQVECNFNKKQLDIFVTELMTMADKLDSFSDKNMKDAVYKADKDLKLNNKRNEKFISLMKDSNVCRLVNEQEVMDAFIKYAPSNNKSEQL